MKPTTIIVLSLALSSGAILLSQQCGCLHKQDVKEQMKDATAIATCVATHWGEDWTQLLAACSALGLDLFYDIVAENENTATLAIAEDAGATRKTLSNRSTQATDGGQPTGDRITKPKGSYYAMQPPIASRLLQRRKDGG